MLFQAQGLYTVNYVRWGIMIHHLKNFSSSLSDGRSVSRLFVLLVPLLNTARSDKIGPVSPSRILYFTHFDCFRTSRIIDFFHLFIGHFKRSPLIEFWMWYSQLGGEKWWCLYLTALLSS